MITSKDINKIRELRYKKATIEGIAGALNMSTRTVQKYLKAELKEPSTVLLMEEIQALKGMIEKLEIRIKAIEGLTPYTEETKLVKSTIKVPDKNTKLVPDSGLEIEYYTTKDLQDQTGRASRTVQTWCSNEGYKRDGSKGYKLTEAQFEAILQKYYPRGLIL